MQVLFVTSEAFPLIKTGGLADVSGALPKALNRLNTFSGNVKVLLPGYPQVLETLVAPKKIATIKVLNQTCDLILGKMPCSTQQEKGDTSVDVFAIANASLYERAAGPYSDKAGVDWPDNALRFAVLSKVASLLCSKETPYHAWQPDLVHCNDWQTGLVPAYLKLSGNTQIKSIFSIHNLAYQGNFNASCIKALALPNAHFSMDGYEFYGQVSFLKAGLYYADKLTTVSPTYAKEIQTPAYGFGLQGLLTARKNDLVGILNGIDTQIWDPATDEYLVTHYSNDNIAGKKAVKRHLQTKLKLQQNKHAPLLGIVSRFADQKGLDLLPGLIPRLVEVGCQFAILGSGDKAIEAKFLSLAQQYPGNVSVNVDYNESLSHHIMAGCDMFVMPSRFEPCGLNQMYGMAYGTPPIVSRRGGLADSVVDTNAATLKAKTATGFVIEEVSESALLAGVLRAINCWSQPAWRQIQRNGMQRDLCWKSRAQEYANLYQALVTK